LGGDRRKRWIPGSRGGYLDGEFANIDRQAIMTEVAAAARRFENDTSGDPAVLALPIVELTRPGTI